MKVFKLTHYQKRPEKSLMVKIYFCTRSRSYPVTFDWLLKNASCMLELDGEGHNMTSMRL